MNCSDDTDFLDVLRNNKKLREERRKQFDIAEKNIKKIVKRSKVIRYPTHKDAYDYVDSLFRGSNIKEVEIYIASSGILEKYGFGEKYGFFYIPDKMVFIRSNVGEYSIDEVIVHELIHYSFNKEDITYTDIEMEEERAYGWTIGYLRKKGHSDEQIINNFLKEYYLSFMQDKAVKKFMAMDNGFKDEYIKASNKKRIDMLNKNYKKIQDIANKISLEKSRVLMDIYNEKLKIGTPFSLFEKKIKDFSRFEFIDLD